MIVKAQNFGAAVYTAPILQFQTSIKIQNYRVKEMLEELGFA